jgi:hypothetical protein
VILEFLLNFLTGSAGVSPAIEREARKRIDKEGFKIARLQRVAGESSTPTDKKHLLGTPHSRAPSKNLL